ncbi:glycine-rich domain-containing protein 1 [Physcomitrium patens]|uniref:GRPD C-terminal domain-containing protein n=1 Tax=Physcomitrium patens TaxID=3218 RepID=A0A2K1K3X9_PHYPA|nr:glycine-rich domain-containing protein 1-like [Physcomitrium patens]PNR48480.1 hypothetical protein PHYPA_012957 [Physcomitrium patens]|eukprot:XP_024383677.1 glycine-rich domain-containing protein 1-like [Physcomitrella patens]
MASEPAEAAIALRNRVYEHHGPDRVLDPASYHQKELNCACRIEISVDLVSSAKLLLGFLRTIDSIENLHRGPALAHAIRRYAMCWMPLAAEAASAHAASSDSQTPNLALLPPLDVQWVWHCHCLSPLSYREYCMSKFGLVVEYTVLLDAPSEESARKRCKDLWCERYPAEPFNDNIARLFLTTLSERSEEDELPKSGLYDELEAIIARQSTFYYQVSQPYMWEERFLLAALERYRCFLHVVKKSRGDIVCVPTYDIDLMWHAHQLSPVAYARDTEALMGCVIHHDDSMERGPHTELEEGFDSTSRLWEDTFGQPYERAGTMYRGAKPVNLPAPPHDGHDGQEILERVPAALSSNFRPPDVNTRFRLLVPRRIVHVCIFMKREKNLQRNVKVDIESLFVRLRAKEAHKLLKIDTPIVLHTASELHWEMLCLLQCEVATVGVVLELRCHVKGCLRTLKQSKLIGSTLLTWGNLQNCPMLSTETVLALNDKMRAAAVKERSQAPELRLSASITPPVQGPYLLKTVPDRVTDDAGAMLSNLILRMNKYQPQQGRWITRTVLNHFGRECFVIRIRQAKGIWRKSGDRPIGVDWHERVINISEGGWTYVAGATGFTSGKVVGSAVPCADELEHDQMSWQLTTTLTTGLTLVISKPFYDSHDWEQNLEFSLTGSSTSLVRLINGRKLQYLVNDATPEQEDGFVTLVRYNAQAPQGKATALFNWKVSAMEVHPEEDVVLVLLLCIATMRSVADLGGKHLGNLFARHRHKEHKPGRKDWNSVVLEHVTSQSNLAMWYLNTPATFSTRDDGTDTHFNHAGSMGGACGSSCQAGDGMVSFRGNLRLDDTIRGWREVSRGSSSINTIGAWGRRTGSGIPLDYASNHRKER